MKSILLILILFILSPIIVKCQFHQVLLNPDSELIWTSYTIYQATYKNGKIKNDKITTIRSRFDSIGNMIELTQKDGNKVDKTELLYNSLGKIIEMRTIDIDGQVNSKIFYNYEKGKLSSETHYKFSKISETYYYKYDQSGQKIECKILTPANKIKNIYYSYDTKGNLIEERTYPFQNIKRKQNKYILTVNEYNYNNKKVLIKIYKKNKLLERTIFEYDNTGILLKTETNHKKSYEQYTRVVEYSYDKNGKKLTEVKLSTVLNDSEYNFETRVFDIIYLDQLPPEITIISPSLINDSIYTVHDNNITLEGNVKDDNDVSSLFINNKEIPVLADGSFKVIIPLNMGKNLVHLEATDRNNKVSEIITIERISSTDFDFFASSDNSLEKFELGEYFALIVGVNEYIDNSVIDLQNPISDATRLLNTLTNYYTFYSENIIFLKNPSRSDIINTLDQLKYKIKKDDNFLIFFAGHGNWDDKANQGYWLPSDATQFSTANWIRNTTIQEYLARIEAKHTLIISDACFAGSIFVTRRAFNDSDIGINKLYSLPSRKAMTSGTFKEVPDKSVFLEFLIKRLQQNQKKYLSSGELFNNFRNAVLNNSPNVPQFGVIQDVGDEGGDFIFIRK